MMQRPFSLISLTLFLSLLSLAGGCGPKKDSDDSNQKGGVAACSTRTSSVLNFTRAARKDRSEPASFELQRRDVQDFADFSSDGAVSVDAQFSGAFSAIFGGTSGARVRAFYDERVKRVVDIDTLGIEPDSFANDCWLSRPAGPASDLLGMTAEDPKTQVETGAVNIGTLFWLRGLINQVPVYFAEPNGDRYEITSSRTGVIMLGSGYKEAAFTEEGKVIVIPAAYRQSILIHEARHSDCTGGITRADVRKLAALKDSTEFERAYPTMPCGHLHRTCKQGALKGIVACDGESWGAYSIGSLYALAGLRNAKSAMDQAVLRALVADQLSRVEVNLDDLARGALGKPDISSQGLRE